MGKRRKDRVGWIDWGRVLKRWIRVRRIGILCWLNSVWDFYKRKIIMIEKKNNILLKIWWKINKKEKIVKCDEVREIW